MHTVCPKCALTLVVTAADLRVAQGYVRCGRCSSVFNALAQLSDERAAGRGGEPAPSSAAAPEPEPEPQQPQQPPQPRQPARPAAASPPQATPGKAPPAPVAPEEAPIPEDALEFNPERTDASSIFVAATPDPEWTAATGSFKALIAANQEAIAPEPKPTAANDDIDLDLEAALLSQIVDRKPQAPATEPTPAPPEPAAQAVPPAQRRTPKPVAAAAPAAAPRALQELAHEAEPPVPQDPDEELAASFEPQAAKPATRGARLWAAGAALLALVLVAQLINHQRDALATDPRFGAPLAALYASLGVPLAPHWDLHAYDVHQLGATVAPGAGTAAGTITVRASIRNAGTKPQPLPLLRVTLEDRFGNRLASRDVAPRDYLPRSVAPAALMSVDQRVDAELAFVDPGSSAVGFELDACLPVRGGTACANDANALK